MLQTEPSLPAELRAFDGPLHSDRLSEAENLAVNLISFFLDRNATDFRDYVVAEMENRMPSTPPREIEAAYDRACEEMLTTYSH
jgi:hypothetical protein